MTGAPARLLVVASEVPFRRHGQIGVSAVHIVLRELIGELGALGHRLALQVVFTPFRAAASLSPAEMAELEDLRAQGVEILAPFHRKDYLPPGSRRGARFAERLLRLAAGRAPVDEIYPSHRLVGALRERAAASRAQAILSIWSAEGVAATDGIRDLPRVSYQGDVDFFPGIARLAARRLSSARRGEPLPGRWLEELSGRMWLTEFRRAHLRLMREVGAIANVTASNAHYYRRRGHPRSLYVGNTWSDTPPERRAPAVPRPRDGRPVRIVGHVGRLGATGSTFGLRYLLVDLLPALETAMAGLDYEIHIIGSGETAPMLQPLLGHPRVVLRGFVEDLDAELHACDAFLMLNNAGPYRAAFTRHVVAWSMGLCLVVHANSREAIPEIRHLENALVGATPQEIAGAVRLAATDPAASARVRAGGRATYEQSFRPAVVARRLSETVQSVAGTA